jgi:hypothetical protein
MAGAQQALQDLGLESELEKTAILGALASAGARVLPWIGRGLWGAAKGLGKGLWSAGGKAINAAGAANKALASPFGAAGNRAVQNIGTRLGASPQTIGKIQGLGRGMARDAMGFGLFGGGIEAAMADPGERGKAFLHGFGTGALGGAAWRGAGNLTSAGMRKLMPNAMKNMEGLAKAAPGDASFLKRWGSKAVVGGLPLAAGFGASELVTPHSVASSPSARYTTYAALGQGMMSPRMMGAFPSGPGYNPNLPLPQGRY